jgi:L-ascorbate metabolism protein UlaG (beta-lactamase superfamily)
MGEFMPLIPNLNETDAVKCANDYKALIVSIQDLNDKTSATTIKQLKKIFSDLINYTDSILVTIYSEAKANNLTEIDNYYYRYLLEQISRYNQFFNVVREINDTRGSQTDAVTFPGKQVLEEKIGMSPVRHPLLQQSNSVTMNVTLRTNDKGETFQSHFQFVEGGVTRHYYVGKEPGKENQEHPAQAHYKKANAQIFLATQGTNVLGLAKQNWNHGSDAYFKISDRVLHAQEKANFETALQNIKDGKALTDEQLQVLEAGKFYRYPKPIRFLVEPFEEKENADQPNHKITHVGHASEILTMNNRVPLTLSIDPVHYQSGTGGLISLAAKTFYDRNTAPALTTDSYPKMNVVIISHNHHDHMCPCSLREGFAQSNTLFIVPKGDSKHMKSFGLKNANIVEFNSWNDSAEITLTNEAGESSRYEVRALPANHASNRGATDFYESLYMGYMVRDLDKKHVVLFTGDTGILSDTHFDQLEKYLVDNDLILQTACIAHGPDRPRKWMECTHQSTADAIAMHARFNMMNAAVYAKKHNKKLTDLTFAELQQCACNGIGYHQGCYRLGVLSNQDVNTTILRMLATLKSIANVPLKDINEDLLADNIFYRFMDKFEQQGVLDTVKKYARIASTLTAGQAAELVSSHLTIPIPGAAIDFQAPVAHPGFVFDYESLLQNRDPTVTKYNPNAAAYEYFSAHITPNLYYPNVKTRELIKFGLETYLNRPRKTYASSKAAPVSDFIKRMPAIADEDLVSELGKFYSKNFQQQDEGIRDEGHLHTMLTILGGLIQFPEFRHQFKERFHEMRPELSQPQFFKLYNNGSELHSLRRSTSVAQEKQQPSLR